MKLGHFEEVVAIADRGSIRAAARQLGAAQPALTRSLALLERQLGASLFERRPRGVVPTPLGRAFVARARSILTEVRRAREEVDQLRGLSTGTVTVGLSIAAHLSLLPACLRPFRSRFPDIRLHIIEGFYPMLEGGLRDGSVDFYVGPDAGAPPTSNLTKEVLFQNRRIVLCRKGHPLARAKSLAELCDADWITTSITTDATAEFAAVFAQMGLPPPKIALRTQSAMTLMTCLSNSDLVAMVPIQWSDFSLTRDVLSPIPIGEVLSAPPLVVVRRSDLPLTPAATHFLDLIRQAKDRM